MLQESVDALIDNQMRSSNAARGRGRRPLRSLADSIQGKTGRFRRNLLGKRVDYSARSVIAVGVDLKMSECGLPKKMALELFKPFVIKDILDQELAYNIKGASRLIEQGTPEIWAILEKVVQGKFVLLNRAPTLHRLGIQAFRPLLIEGNAIRVHPLVCAAFNADFDGDQMAVHLPLSRQAQEESKNIMLSGVNLRKPATGLPVTIPSQDIVLGIYFLTTIADSLADEKVKYFADTDEALLCYQNGGIGVRTIARINIKPNLASEPELLRTTVGRILFNQILPENYPFFNKLVDKKTLVRITTDIIEKNFLEESQVFLDQMKKIGCQYSSLSGVSLGINDFVTPQEKGKLVNMAEKKVLAINKMGDKGLFSKREERNQIVDVWQEVISTLKKLVPQELPKDGSLSIMVTSGARGSWDQPFQMCGMKGLVANPAGRIIELPVVNSFKEGLDVLGYFISTHGARKGMADKALRTSSAGYLTRRLVDVAHDVLIREEDCGDTDGLTVSYQDAESIEQSFAFKIVGRYVLSDVIDPETKNKIAKKGKLIDWDQARQIENLKINKVKVRSPLTCKAVGGICQKCYGWDMGVNKLIEIGQAVGIIAAQSIGEPGTQLTMRTFHLGGVAGGGDITQGLPRAEELFENRIPKIQALTASKDGIVREVDLKERVIKIEASGKNAKRTTREYHTPESLSILVKVGDKVKKGQRLSEGVIRPDHIFKYFGERAAQNYIVQEVQKVYAGEGVKIHDKHLEVIARQMFSRVKVVDGGDSFWNTDEIITRHQLDQKNKELSEQKKAKVVAVPVLLGVSRIALSSESFLSAASFQETSQILIRAALRKQKDKLRWLKENGRIGKLIPAGTGRTEK
jgi:DNA-directed RNA polymerase subunit beta'